ncbi:hypothetical protein [Rhizobium sp. BK176]|uniref:hypothetical protein n=1 Tax=Rhizobium sp. BK176 TaxID=2587071 RepID=UPI002168E0DF|nr:hypothetical protein [Rhizobium sp. BK176]MCS4096727.1 uncharacterized membrane protein YtjA (UPF0391 family) [Rhizobium sp. BK176]
MNRYHLEGDSIDQFPAALVHWADQFRRSDQDEEALRRAIAALNVALTQAQTYLDDVGEVRQERRWNTPAFLFKVACRSVAVLDPAFADKMKSFGWGTEDFWSDAKQSGKIHIPDIRTACVVIEARLSGREPDLEEKPVGNAAQDERSKLVLIIASVLAALFGLGCISGGLLLMAAPGGGATSFDFLGFQVSTHQTGIAAIALGAASIILTFRMVLKTVVARGRTT